MGTISLALGTVIVVGHPHKMTGGPSLADYLMQVVYGLFGVAGPLDYAGRAAGTVGCSRPPTGAAPAPGAASPERRAAAATL